MPVHRLQIRVPVGSIHHRVKLRGQMHRLPADAQPEIRRVRIARDLDAIELALIISARRQHARDSLEHRKIRVIESVGARNRRERRILDPTARISRCCECHLAVWRFS